MASRRDCVHPASSSCRTCHQVGLPVNHVSRRCPFPTSGRSSVGPRRCWIAEAARQERTNRHETEAADGFRPVASFVRAGIAIIKTDDRVYCGKFAACDFYRQRFFLDFRGEWDLHWRSGFVAFVKWPTFILAFVDALAGKYGACTVTSKLRRSPRALGFAAVHGADAAAVIAAWLINRFDHPTEFLAIHIAAAFALQFSLIALLTVFRRYPEAYDARLRRSWDERLPGTSPPAAA